MLKEAGSCQSDIQGEALKKLIYKAGVYLWGISIVAEMG